MATRAPEWWVQPRDNMLLRELISAIDALDMCESPLTGKTTWRPQAAAAAVALKTNSVMLVPEGSPDVLRFEALAQSGKGEEGGSMPQANLLATEEPFTKTMSMRNTTGCFVLYLVTEN